MNYQKEATVVSALFVPLKMEWFEAFASGIKTEEYRPYGARWNERTCAIGRPVCLSLGYGKHKRLHGVVTGFCVKRDVLSINGWQECYGDKGGPAACIQIALDFRREGAAS